MASKKLRILRIIARMNVGGPAIQVSTLINGLPLDQFDQRLLIGDCDDEELDYLELNSISIPRIKIKGLGRSINFVSDLRAFLSICREIHKYQPHVIHTHTFKAGLLGRVAAMLVRSRASRVHTFHGHLLYGYVSGAKLKLLVFLEQFLSKRTDVLVSVGEQVKVDLISKSIGVPSQFVTIPPGFEIDGNLLENSHPREHTLRNSEFLCVWVGRMVTIKRPDRLVEIGRLLKSSPNSVRILVAGDGPLRQAIESTVIAESLPITFLGWSKDIHQVIVSADLLLLTSENEGTPVSIIEAQRLGRPVVTTDVGSAKEVILNDESGFALDYSATSFVERIKLLSRDNDLYLKFCESARSFASERFTAKRLVDDHIQIYRKVASLKANF